MSTDAYGLDDDATDRVFQALANRERRRMLDLVRSQPGCIVSGVAAVFTMSRVGVLKHLKVLEDAGLVVSIKEGRERRLYANAEPIQTIYERWTTQLDRYWAASLVGLKRDVEAGGHKKSRGRTTWATPRKKSSAPASRGRSKPSGTN